MIFVPAVLLVYSMIILSDKLLVSVREEDVYANDWQVDDKYEDNWGNYD